MAGCEMESGQLELSVAEVQAQNDTK